MTEQSFCLNPKCNNVAEGITEKCPKCGGKMQTPKQVERMGFIQLICGAVLTILSLLMGFEFLPATLGIEGSDATTHFSGTTSQGIMILGFLGFLLLIGLMAIITGMRHIKTRQRSKLNFWIFVLIFVFYMVVLSMYKSFAN